MRWQSLGQILLQKQAWRCYGLHCVAVGGIGVRQKQESIPELPAENHPFFLLPERSLRISGSNGQSQIKLSYRQAGQGKPILLLPGLWTSAYTFRHLIEPLSGNFRLIMPDLIDPEANQVLPQADYRPERLADLIHNICKALELERPIVVAHAESGLACLLLGLNHPDCLGSLVAIATAVSLPALSGFKGRFMAHPWLVERRAQNGFKRPIQTAIGMLEYADSAVFCRQEIRELARRWANLPGANLSAKILAQTRTPLYRRGLMQKLMAGQTSFPVPLKLIFGQADSLATPAQGQKLNRLLPGSELLIAEQCAGAVQVEKPEWLAKIIQEAAQG